jgi:NADPH:quinone reductase-like Zn-dependent oxidoreductase
MSRVVIMRETGGPEVLRLEQRETPRPGPGEVLIRIGAFGLNRSDTMVRTGAYPLHRLPASLGLEAAGIVETLGAGIAGLAAGDRVAVIPQPTAGFTTYGEHVVVPSHLVVPVSPEMGLAAASGLWGVALTAYQALIRVAGLAAGEQVVVSAASSGLGIAAIQVARQAGAIPLALTRRLDKADRLREAGAAHVFATDADIATAVQGVTNGKGARVVFDSVGAPLLADLVRSAATCGIVLLNGVLGGSEAMLPVAEVMMRRLTVRGIVLVELLEDARALAGACSFIDQGVAAGVIRPLIAATFPLDQIVDAHRFLESGEQVGKVIVTVD